MNLNQITLPVHEMETAAAFYRQMGCLQIVDTAHYARFESPLGSATFSLSLSQDGFGHGVTIYFEVEDVDREVARLESVGLTIRQQPSDKSWLWREAELTDPSGNSIKIYHAGINRCHPPWRVERR